MVDIPKYPFESEVLNENWELLKPFYDSLKEILDDHDPEEEEESSFGWSLFDSLYDRVYHEWQQIYVKVVLEPVRERILEIFKEALLKEFKTQPKIKEYYVLYYVLQYFFVGIQPKDENEEHFRIDLESSESKNMNRHLYFLIDVLWEELELTELSGEQIFYDSSEFYDLEVEYLLDFLSELWNEAKAITKVNATAILTEATAAGSDYRLDDKSVIEE
jgi:hypothetical protein